METKLTYLLGVPAALLAAHLVPLKSLEEPVNDFSDRVERVLETTIEKIWGDIKSLDPELSTFWKEYSLEDGTVVRVVGTQYEKNATFIVGVIQRGEHSEAVLQELKKTLPEGLSIEIPELSKEDTSLAGTQE